MGKFHEKRDLIDKTYIFPDEREIFFEIPILRIAEISETERQFHVFFQFSSISFIFTSCAL